MDWGMHIRNELKINLINKKSISFFFYFFNHFIQFYEAIFNRINILAKFHGRLQFFLLQQ